MRFLKFSLSGLASIIQQRQTIFNFSKIISNLKFLWPLISCKKSSFFQLPRAFKRLPKFYQICYSYRTLFETLKAWRNWPTLLAKHYCFPFKSGVTFLSIDNDSETNKSVCQAILASFARPLGMCSRRRTSPCWADFPFVSNSFGRKEFPKDKRKCLSARRILPRGKQPLQSRSLHAFVCSFGEGRVQVSIEAS